MASNHKLSRKEREFLSRRKEIFEAALKLFSTKGYYNTSMQEIAAESEFSTGTLYNFFKNKEELYFSIVGEKSEEIFAKVMKDVATATDPIARIEAMVEGVLKHFETEKTFFKLFIGIRTNFEWEVKDDLGEKLHETHMRFIGLIAEVIKEAIDAGEIGDFDPATLAFILNSSINAIILQWFHSDEDYPLLEKKDIILELFFRGSLRGGK